MSALWPTTNEEFGGVLKQMMVSEDRSERGGNEMPLVEDNNPDRAYAMLAVDTLAEDADSTPGARDGRHPVYKAGPHMKKCRKCKGRVQELLLLHVMQV